MSIKRWFKPMRWIAVAESERGLKEENQDNFLLLEPDGTLSRLRDQQVQEDINLNLKQGIYRLAVADGMGGHDHAREIAEAVIEGLFNLPLLLSPEALREALFQLNAHLMKCFGSGDRSPGSTLVMADVCAQDGRAVIATVGDSRALLWRDNRWTTLTYDHVMEEYDWRDGLMDDITRSFTLYGKSNTLAQVMGFGSFGLVVDRYGQRPKVPTKDLRLDLVEELRAEAQSHADLFNLQLLPGDALLLASDGLWGVPSDLPFPPVPDTCEAEILSCYLQSMIRDTVGHLGCRDNVTLVLLKNLR